MKPTANYLLVAVPQRFVSQYAPGQNRLVLPSGSDDWMALDAQIRAGENVQIETDETPIPVCQGAVLAVPDRLTADMMLCASPHTMLVPYREPVLRNGKTFRGQDGQTVMRNTARLVEQQIPRTAADITELVSVGDRIHFDESALSDESEVSPGVYLIGYADVIALLWCVGEGYWGYEHPNVKKQFQNVWPLAGYVLLTRVWATDVVEAAVEGRIRKVRYGKSGLIDQVDVPPLSNEGIVAFHSTPLRGTVQEAFAGDRVIIDHRFAREETIAGVLYLAVRQDYVLAVRGRVQLLPDNLTEIFRKSTLSTLTQSDIDELCSRLKGMPIVMRGFYMHPDTVNETDENKEACMMPYAVVLPDKTPSGRNTLRQISWEEGFQALHEFTPGLKLEKPDTIGGYSDTLLAMASVFSKYV